MKRTVYADRTAWLKGREKTLGASDAASSVGLNTWKSNYRLWEEKTGRKQPEDISGKDCVIFGNDAEPLIRGLFKLEHPEYEVYYNGVEIITSDERPWQSCSLDGELLLDPVKGVLEIKTSEIKSAAAATVWNNRVPDHYLCQVYHQLAVTGYSFAILRAHLRDVNGVNFSRDVEHMFSADEHKDSISWLVEQEEKFWKCVTTDTPPALILPEL